jgi:hypothetical protein
MTLRARAAQISQQNLNEPVAKFSSVGWPNGACQLAVFSGKLPSMEAEIYDKLTYNSR